MKFESLSICDPLLKNLERAGFENPTPIQQKAIPDALSGRDLLGCAQTGTGKTAAFALPVLQRLILAQRDGKSLRPSRTRRPIDRTLRALILTPTRELAAQIGQCLQILGKDTGLRHAVIFGGVRQGPQVHALEAGIDVLVATPGRLLDLLEQGHLNLSHVEMLVLDEADQMLDMGFIHDLKRIVARVPRDRQTLMFSATMPDNIRELASRWLRRPVEVKVAPVASTPDRVDQSVCFVEQPDKPQALVRILNEITRSKTLVFSRTKHGADKIVRRLSRDGIHAVAIHGNKSQSQRTSAMQKFSTSEPPVLVATDIAARGLDFSDVSHVINYDLPDTPETYVHRIGRTARAGASGQAISLCSQDERDRLRMIERLTRKRITVKNAALESSALQSATVIDESAVRGRFHSTPRTPQTGTQTGRSRRPMRPVRAATRQAGPPRRLSRQGR